ncbi:MAG: thiamine-phosphate kinase [Bacillota bacterium]
MKVKDIGEFGLISTFAQNCIFNKSELIVGIGDDAAVLPLDKDNYLLAASDMLIENLHFLTNSSTPFQIGYKAIAVNFSDIAAMGGWPTGVLISLGIPPYTSVDFIEEIYFGMKEICSKYNANIIGGDTVSTINDIIINVSVLGKVKKNELHLRSHAKVNDVVFCTGTLGDSAAGLAIIKSKDKDITLPPSVKNILLKKHLAPEPCLIESKVLNIHKGLNALNDISDGLASEIHEIAEASNVGIYLYPEKIPISNEAKLASDSLGINPLDWALYGGEDFQLVGTISSHNFDQIKDIFKRKLGREIYDIGKVTDLPGVYFIDRKSNKRKEIDKKGYNHFNNNVLK